MDITLTINGERRTLPLEDPRVTLLDALRQHLDLPGTKKGCDHGQCGACTVMLNGRRINACLTLAVMHQGDEITTIEGLGTPEALSPLQAAFIRHDGFQCGYCTAGFLNEAQVLLESLEHQPVSREALEQTILEALDGHLCRCTGYVRYHEAVRDVILAQPARYLL